MGNKIFSEIIERKNRQNENYCYECLATLDEYSPYDLQVHKHCNDDWGNMEISYHEVKLRNEDYSFTSFTNSYIDVYKICQLQKIAYLTSKDVFVNMIYPKDRAMLIWKIEPDVNYTTIHKTNINWKSESVARGQDIRLEKDFVLLSNDEAVKIKY